MARCDYCGREVALPYRCKYCGGLFCVEHHLPEKHDCPGLSKALSPATVERSYRAARAIGVTVYRPRRARRKVGVFYPGEVRDLGIAFLAVFAVFAYPWALTLRGALAVLAASVTAFLFHELAHKVAAQYLGYTAKFRLSNVGLALTLLSAIPQMPIRIVMPGYVEIFSYYPSRRTMGLVALAGPLTNFIVCLALMLSPFPILTALAVKLNALVAFFNLIPLGELDGRKVMSWSWPLWLAMISASLILYYLVGF